MRTRLKHPVVAVVAIAVAASVLAAACTRDGNAQTGGFARGAVAPAARDDTASVARLLATVRGVDPLLCELAVRAVDMHGHWSRWGSSSDGLLTVDSAAAALLEWIEREHRDARIVAPLRAGLRDADGCVRRVSGSFLARVEDPSAAAALVGALDDPSAATRQAAAVGLGMADEPAGAIAPLMKRLRDDAPAVRRSAAWALGALQAKDASSSLIDLLARDTDPRTRQAAAWALGRISQ